MKRPKRNATRITDAQQQLVKRRRMLNIDPTFTTLQLEREIVRLRRTIDEHEQQAERKYRLGRQEAVDEAVTLRDAYATLQSALRVVCRQLPVDALITLLEHGRDGHRS